jgi:hypothetical protein
MKFKKHTLAVKVSSAHRALSSFGWGSHFCATLPLNQSGITVKETLMTWTAVETIISVVALNLILNLDMFV